MKTQLGIYEKFRVERTDGRSMPGEKHHECSYFVIDLHHDEFAIPALLAYAEACKAKYPVLAEDLLLTAYRIKYGESPFGAGLQPWEKLSNDL